MQAGRLKVAWWAILLVLFTSTGSGCSDVDQAQAPALAVTPSPITLGSPASGATVERTITLRNDGAGALRVQSLRVEGARAADFTLAPNAGLSLAPGEATTVRLTFVAASSASIQAELVVVSNDPRGDFRVPIVAGSGSPQLLVVPDELDIGTVGEGLERRVEASLINIGAGNLIFCGAALDQGDFFSTDLEVEIDNVLGGFAQGEGLAALDNAEGGVTRLDFHVTFSPSRLARETDTLFIRWDSSGDPDGLCEGDRIVTSALPLRGQGVNAELLIEPCPVSFGESPINFRSNRQISLRNLGNQPLRILGVSLDAARSAPTFSLRSLPTFPADMDEELLLFQIDYQPTEPVAEAALLEVDYQRLDESGSPIGDVLRESCPISAVAVERECPFSVGRGSIREDPSQRRSAELPWAAPLQTLVLDGRDSFSPDGRNLTYTWTVVEQPSDSVQGLRPVSTDPGNDALREFFLPITGRYVFALEVEDDTGIPNCEPSFVTVTATPQRRLSIELTWRTPDDPDETDSVGSDLDLHFVKIGEGRWFDERWDTFFGNNAPDWNPERPSLDFDVTNGRGPETITMDNPQDCQWYAVGVHYFAFRWGPSYANLRIFADGQLIFERLNVPLQQEADFWDVGRLHWPSGEFFEAGIPPRVYRNFDARDRVRPEAVDGIAESGLCGDFP